MKTLCALFVAGLALAATWGIAAAQGTATVYGRVVDESTGEPLPGAAVVVEESHRGSLADPQGRFVIAGVRSGEWDVSALLVGYRSETRPIELAAGDSLRLDFALTETAIQSSPLVVTASRRLEELRRAPTAMSVVSSDELRTQNRTTTKEALANVPGVTTVGGQVSFRGSSGYTQGAGSRVAVLIDGLPVLTGDAGDVKWGMFPPVIFDRVELLKGASSALYGSGALDGVVNHITMSPSAEPLTRIQITAGMYGHPPEGYRAPPGGRRYYNSQSAVHARIVGKTGVLAAVRRHSYDGSRVGGAGRRYQAFAKVTRDVTSSLRLGTMGLYSDEQHEQVLQSYPDSLHYVRGPGNDIDGPEQFVSIWARQALSERFSWRVTGHFFRSAFDERTQAGVFVWDSDARTAGLEAQATFLPRKGLRITVGGSASRSWIDGAMNLGESASDAALFALSELDIADWLRGTAGVHLDRRTMDMAETTTSLSPRLGVVLTPARFTTLRATLSKGFRGASVAEMTAVRDEGDIAVRPNPSLSPETGWTAEFGASQVLGRHAAVDLAVFENRYYDMIEPVVQDSTQPGTGQLLVKFENVIEAHIRGLEATARAALWQDRLRGSVSYMHLDARNLSPGATRTAGEDSSRLAYRPRHTVVASTGLDLGSVFAGYEFRYVGTYPMMVYPNDPIEPQIVSDVRLGLRWKQVTVTATVDNLFNYVYAERERRLSGPRNYGLSVELEF